MGIGVVGYVLAFGLTLLLTSPFLDQLWKLMFVPNEAWFPSTSIRTAPMNGVVFLMLGSWIAYWMRAREVRRGEGKPRTRAWLRVRAILVAGISIAYFGSHFAVTSGRRLVDTRWLEAVDDLHTGMARGHALQRVGRTRAFTEPLSDEPERVRFDRSYNQGFGSEWSVRYELVLDFDTDERLIRAVYIRKTDDFDVGRHDCDILIERPARTDEPHCAKT